MYNLQHSLYIGDRIMFKNDYDKTGTIGYIGYLSDRNEEIIGIHSDQWNPNYHDGTINNQRLFTALDGYGIYAKRNEIEIYNENKRQNAKE